MTRRSGGIKIECTKELFNMLSEGKRKIADEYDQTGPRRGAHTLSSPSGLFFFLPSPIAPISLVVSWIGPKTSSRLTMGCTVGFLDSQRGYKSD